MPAATLPPRHLLTLAGMPAADITALLDGATTLRAQTQAAEPLPQLLGGRTVFNLFFEPSTRTRSSFELAARRLGAMVINFDAGSSSTSKGESLEDTIATLEAMDADAFVVRHAANGIVTRLAQATRRAAMLNAGDGNNAHPTQGLLDLLTIRDHKGTFNALTVAVCGDVRHSRVARSAVHGLQAMGVGELRLCAPAELMPPPDDSDYADCDLLDDMDAALRDADVIIMLRLQKERMHAALGLSSSQYFARYGLDGRRLKLARRDAIVLHPGPVNRGIEIADAVADGAQSMILQQVRNGIHVRMAALARAVGAAL